jgi:hypothetical protein
MGEPLPFRRAADGRWVSATAFPYGSPANYLGWKRQGRSQAIDLDLIVNVIPDNAWRTCPKARLECLDTVGRPFNVLLYTSRPLLCGRVGLVRLHPIPWESAKRKRVNPVAEYVVTDIRCTRR